MPDACRGNCLDRGSRPIRRFEIPLLRPAAISKVPPDTDMGNSASAQNENCSALEGQLVSLIGENLLETGSSFNAASDLFDAGLDSMAIMQLLVLIEGEMGVAIPAEEVSRDNFQTATAIAALMRKHGATE